MLYYLSQQILHAAAGTEWAERLSFVPWPRTVRVALAHAGGDAREIEIQETSQ
jgi:tRNA A37 threonylcarbamoyladenosine biosynthesis protein TsaE